MSNKLMPIWIRNIYSLIKSETEINNIYIYVIKNYNKHKIFSFASSIKYDIIVGERYTFKEFVELIKNGIIQIE